MVYELPQSEHFEKKTFEKFKISRFVFKQSVFDEVVFSKSVISLITFPRRRQSSTFEKFFLCISTTNYEHASIPIDAHNVYHYRTLYETRTTKTHTAGRPDRSDPSGEELIDEAEGGQPETRSPDLETQTSLKRPRSNHEEISR